MINAQRDTDGKFSKFAWPGGYPCFAICEDGGVLCIPCANGDNGSEASEAADTPKDWKLEAIDVNWGDPDLTCDHCNVRIESAYAEDK